MENFVIIASDGDLSAVQFKYVIVGTFFITKSVTHKPVIAIKLSDNSYKKVVEFDDWSQPFKYLLNVKLFENDYRKEVEAARNRRNGSKKRPESMAKATRNQKRSALHAKRR